MQVRFENDHMRSSVKVYLFEDSERARVFYTKGGEEAHTVQDGSVLQAFIEQVNFEDPQESLPFPPEEK